MTELQQKFAENVGKLIAYAYANGMAFTFGDAWAKTGHMANSLHYERLAVDFNLFVEDKWIVNDAGDTSAWDELAGYWKSLDPLNRWGGDIKDKVDLNHFSMATSTTDNRI